MIDADGVFGADFFVVGAFVVAVDMGGGLTLLDLTLLDELCFLCAYPFQ